MKVCFVTTLSFTMKTFVVDIADSIRKETGWDITLICAPDEEFARIVPAGMHYHPINIKRGVSADMFAPILELYNIFKKEKFDLVQYSTGNASFCASIAAKLAHIPARLYCQWGIDYLAYSGVKRQVFKTTERIICNNSTIIEPDSVSNLKFGRKEGLYSEDKSRVVWNGSAKGLDIKKFDYKNKEKYKEKIYEQYPILRNSMVLGFVGRICADKGCNELIRAFIEISQSKENAYLLLVGPFEKNSNMDNELNNFIHTSKKVLLVGQVNNVEEYLSVMDIFVFPSYREGFGMSVIEAEAMGVPVIVSDIPGPIDAMIHKETGLIVPVKDVNALVEAIQDLINNEAYLMRMGENAVRYVHQNFEYSIFVKKYIEDRQSILS